MLLKNIFIVALLLIIGTSCVNNSFDVNETGLEYKFIEKNDDNNKPEVGDVIAIAMYFEDSKGEVVEELTSFRIQLKKPSHVGGSIEDACAMMHKGDSAIFKINAYNYYEKTRNIPVPDNINGDEKLTFYLRMINITPYSEFVKERETARLSDERQEEFLLKDFLKRTNVQVEPTMSGLYFIEVKRGTGSSPKPGKMVTVHYTGYFINGKVFDSSYERNEPFKFKYGIGQVIQGWDEGVAKMKVGGKYKLIIPSYLAYGNEKKGPIPPNSTLVFEIELLDVE